MEKCYQNSSFYPCENLDGNICNFRVNFGTGIWRRCSVGMLGIFFSYYSNQDKRKNKKRLKDYSRLVQNKGIIYNLRGGGG